MIAMAAEQTVVQNWRASSAQTTQDEQHGWKADSRLAVLDALGLE